MTALAIMPWEDWTMSSSETASPDPVGVTEFEASQQVSLLPHIYAQQELLEVYRNCAEIDWDGYGAKSVAPLTLLQAKRFLAALPSTVPAPEVGADPDGDISFEWCSAPRWVFSVSVNSCGDLVYAGLFGEREKHHGVMEFTGSLPHEILAYIMRTQSAT